MSGILFDGSSGQRSAAQHDARKQAQAGAERSLADSEKYNAALRLFIVDDRLKRLVDAYCGMTEEARAELATAAEQSLLAHPREVR